GVLLTLPMALGPRSLGPITFSLNWMFLGLMLSVLGLHGVYVGSLARVFFDYSGETTRLFLQLFSYTRSVILSIVAVVIGAVMTVPLIREYVRSGYRLASDVLPLNHLAVAGLLLVIIGSMNFTSTLTLHAAVAN